MHLADYSFGEVQKGWAEDLGSDSGALQGSGVTVASQKLGDAEAGRVYSYEVAATVEDIDRQAISKTDSRLVFSSEQLLGAKITSDTSSEDSLYFVKKGQPFTLKVVSVDADGKPYPTGAVKGRLIREDWKLVRQLTVGGMVDTHYEKQEVVEKEFSVSPGSHGVRRSLPRRKRARTQSRSRARTGKNGTASHGFPSIQQEWTRSSGRDRTNEGSRSCRTRNCTPPVTARSFSSRALLRAARIWSAWRGTACWRRRHSILQAVLPPSTST